MAEPARPPYSTAALLGLSASLFVGLGAVFGAINGRWDLPWVWAALVAVSGSHAALVWQVFRRDPELVRERASTHAGVPRWDRVVVAFTTALWFPNLLITAWDAPSAAAPVPLRLAGLLAIPVGMGLVGWAMSVNTYFSREVRIQRERGQTAIDRGPYGLIRHPGYGGVIAWWTGFNLAVGSWPGTACSLAIAGLLVLRTALEDRFLRRELPGYEDYARRVRYRLVPGVW